VLPSASLRDSQKPGFPIRSLVLTHYVTDPSTNFDKLNTLNAFHLVFLITLTLNLAAISPSKPIRLSHHDGTTITSSRNCPLTQLQAFQPHSTSTHHCHVPLKFFGISLIPTRTIGAVIAAILFNTGFYWAMTTAAYATRDFVAPIYVIFTSCRIPSASLILHSQVRWKPKQTYVAHPIHT